MPGPVINQPWVQHVKSDMILEIKIKFSVTSGICSTNQADSSTYFIFVTVHRKLSHCSRPLVLNVSLGCSYLGYRDVQCADLLVQCADLLLKCADLLVQCADLLVKCADLLVKCADLLVQCADLLVQCADLLILLQKNTVHGPSF